MTRIAHQCRFFGKSENAVSTIEFAMIFPIILIFLLMGTQIVLYINATRKVGQVATAVAQMISQAPASSDPSLAASVNSVDLNFSYDSALVIFPYVMTDARGRNIPWRQGLTVSMASIRFNKLSNSCDGSSDKSPCYAAVVVWTSMGTSSDKYRPCLSPQTPLDDGGPPSRFGLPRSAFGDGSIIAVDVTFTFNPTFGSGVVSPLTITKSVFVQPRYTSLISFDSTNNDGIARSCP